MIGWNLDFGMEWWGNSQILLSNFPFGLTYRPTYRPSHALTYRLSDKLTGRLTYKVLCSSINYCFRYRKTHGWEWYIAYKPSGYKPACVILTLFNFLFMLPNIFLIDHHCKTSIQILWCSFRMFYDFSYLSKYVKHPAVTSENSVYFLSLQ